MTHRRFKIATARAALRWLSSFRRPAVCGFLALLASCDAASQGSEEATTVYDSAGVVITESRAPVLSPAEGWTVGSAPVAVVGASDDAEGPLFSDIVSAWRRGDGSMVVGDRLALQVMVFDGDGTLVTSFGGEGTGPGEFRRLSALAPYRGDSVIAWDTRSNRLSVFDRRGNFGRTERVALPTVQQGRGERSFAISETLWGAFDDGSLAFSPRMILVYDLDERPVFRRPIYRLSPTGDSLGSVGTFAIAELRGISNPFARLETVAISADRLYSNEADAYEIQVRTADGNLIRIFRLPDHELSVDEDSREAFSDWYTDRQQALERPAEEIARQLSAVRFPSVLPHLSALLVADDEHVWVRDYRFETDPRPGIWNIFHPDGRWLASVETPPHFEVHQVGTDFLLGVRTDELQVPTVEIYPLSR